MAWLGWTGQPTPLWGFATRPFPTGAWWLNLVLNDGGQNVAPLPYAVKASDASGLQVSFASGPHGIALSRALRGAPPWRADLVSSLAPSQHGHGRGRPLGGR
jgi:hypothetical protein